MGFFDFFKQPDIHGGLTRFYAENNGRLLDVRTAEEYARGHIPGSENIPVQSIERLAQLEPRKDKPLYVYCRSGSRSRQAALQLRQLGYDNVTDLGGILSYRGEVVS